MKRKKLNNLPKCGVVNWSGFPGFLFLFRCVTYHPIINPRVLDKFRISRQWNELYECFKIICILVICIQDFKLCIRARTHNRIHYIIRNIYSAINQLVPNIEIKDLGFIRVGFDSALIFHTMADPALPTMSESPVQFALLYATFHMHSLKFCEHVKKKKMGK